MIHTHNFTENEPAMRPNPQDYYDERAAVEEGYYAFNRKELLHNLLMVYQSAFSSGRYNAALQALHLYGKEMGLFQKRSTSPLKPQDLTYGEMEEIMGRLGDADQKPPADAAAVDKEERSTKASDHPPKQEPPIANPPHNNSGQDHPGHIINEGQVQIKPPEKRGEVATPSHGYPTHSQTLGKPRESSMRGACSKDSLITEIKQNPPQNIEPKADKPPKALT